METSSVRCTFRSKNSSHGLPTSWLRKNILYIIFMAPTPTARSADLLLLNRAARLDRGRGLLIAHVNDAPPDALSARELQDLRKTAGSHARSFFGHRSARALLRPRPTSPHTSRPGDSVHLRPPNGTWTDGTRLDTSFTFHILIL